MKYSVGKTTKGGNTVSKLKKVLCAVLSACMISVPLTIPMTVSGEDVSSLEQQLQELEEKNEEYQAVLDKTQSDIKEKEKYKDALVKKVEVLDDKIALTREKIEELNASIEQKQKEVDEANANIEDQLDALSNRLRIIYMAGSATDLEIILGAKDFSDLIDKVQLVKTLSSYDKELIDGIKVELDKISEQKKSLEEDKKEVETQQETLEADQQEFDDLIAENDEILKGLYASSDDAKNALEHAALESAEIEEQIKSYYDEQLKKQQQQQQQQQQNQNQSSGESDNNSGGSQGGGTQYDPEPAPSPQPNASGYTWPVPGFYYLSSEWNEDRNSYNHGAIDIAGSGIMGATVVAADDGYVFASNNSCPHNWGKGDGNCGCGGGYGNYVMIDHGNGKTTIYGHLTNAVVSTGQTVSKGQVIGYVGSTGWSSGPHLHFECRLYGEKYNPMLEF